MKKQKTQEETFAPVLIAENTDQTKKLKSDTDQLLPVIQRAVDAFNFLGLGLMPAQDLAEAIYKPKKYFDSKIDDLIEEPEETVSGFKKKKSSLLAELELPDPTKFISYAEEVVKTFPHLYASINLFTLESSKVVKNKEKINELIEVNRTYLTNPKDIKAYRMIEKMCASIIELNNYAEENYNAPFFSSQNPWLNLQRFFILPTPEKIKPNPFFFNPVTRR